MGNMQNLFSNLVSNLLTENSSNTRSQNQNMYPENNWLNSNQRNTNNSSFGNIQNNSYPNNQMMNNTPYFNTQNNQTNYRDNTNNYRDNTNDYRDNNYRNNQNYRDYNRNMKSEEENISEEKNISEEQNSCKPVTFKKQKDGTFCYVNSKGNLICNQNSVFCNNQNIKDKCNVNDIKYGIDNRMDSAINTLLDYLNTNSNNMKENCVSVVKKYIKEWGLEPHLKKYSKLFKRIALDDPSEEARNYFSNNSILIDLMIQIIEESQEEEQIQEEMQKGENNQINVFEKIQTNIFENVNEKNKIY